MLSLQQILHLCRTSVLAALLLMTAQPRAHAGLLECVFIEDPQFAAPVRAHVPTPYQDFAQMLKNPDPELMAYHWQDELFTRREDPLLPYFRQAIHFTRLERTFARKKLEESRLPRKAKEVLKVALYDEALWRRDFWQYVQFSHAPEMLKQTIWLELMVNLPVKLSDLIQTDIKKNYASYGKSVRDYPGLVEFDLRGPKRGVDNFLQQKGQDASFFTALVKGGLDPWTAYARTAERMRRKYFQTQGLGNYSPDFNLEVAGEVQSILKSHANTKTALVFAGSAVNGRAKFPESDLDFLYVGSLSPTLETSLLAKVTKHFEQRGLRAEFLPDYMDTQELGLHSPFQIRITANKIELVVYIASTTDTENQKPRVYRIR